MFTAPQASIFPVQTLKLSVGTVYLSDIIDSQILELKNHLTKAETDRCKDLRNSRKLEFLTGRTLRTYACGLQEITYDHTGGPTIQNNTYISISHSRTRAALMTSTIRIGVDLERIDARARRAQRRFVAPAEYQFFNSDSDADMCLLWSFKETLYKLATRNGLLFREDLLVQKQDQVYLGWIRGVDHWSCYQLECRQVDDNFLTCNASQPLKFDELPPALCQ